MIWHPFLQNTTFTNHNCTVSQFLSSHSTSTGPPYSQRILRLKVIHKLYYFFLSNMDCCVTSSLIQISSTEIPAIKQGITEGSKNSVNLTPVNSIPISVLQKQLHVSIYLDMVVEWRWWLGWFGPIYFKGKYCGLLMTSIAM